jgi:hypothetical protein
MTDGSTTPEGAVGGAGAQLEIGPDTTTKDILEALRRQGIADLESFVEEFVATVRERADEESGEDDTGWEREAFISEHYVLLHGGTTHVT